VGWDEPFDTSLVIHALSARQRQRVVAADNPTFWNLSWSVIGDPADGTFYCRRRRALYRSFSRNAIAPRRRAERLLAGARESG
jgi:hypothetical protein